MEFLSTQTDGIDFIAWNWGDDPIAPFLRRVCRENAAALLRIQTLMR